MDKGIKTEFLHRFFHDLSDDEKTLIRQSLGYIPTDELQGDYDKLWEMYRNGKAGMFCINDKLGLAAITFYGIEDFGAEKKNLVSYATISLRPLPPDVFAAWNCELDALADLYECESISLRTVRPGLAEKLVKKFNWFASEIVCRRKVKNHVGVKL